MLSPPLNLRAAILAGNLVVGVLILVGAYLYNKRAARTREVQWGNLFIAVLMLVLGVGAITRGRTGRLWFPEMTTFGWPARLGGFLCLVVAVICFLGSVKRRHSDDEDENRRL
jgi:drug/metabolite transporter (DMT)-like permease